MPDAICEKCREKKATRRLEVFSVAIVDSESTTSWSNDYRTETTETRITYNMDSLELDEVHLCRSCSSPDSGSLVSLFVIVAVSFVLALPVALILVLALPQWTIVTGLVASIGAAFAFGIPAFGVLALVKPVDKSVVERLIDDRRGGDGALFVEYQKKLDRWKSKLKG